MKFLSSCYIIRVCVSSLTCISLVLPPVAIAGDGLGFARWRPESTSVELLAKRIDKMERSLNEYGSIVIKTPDVWGESRLMRHRSDVENQLKARLNGFDFRINAVQSTRDAAFLATAIALQEQLAVGDVNPLTGTAITSGAPVPNPTNVNQAAAALVDNPTGVVPRSGFSGNLAAFSGTPTAAPIKVGIEPVIELDQLNRYLQHLNELRRLNEGDDNADTPGYALNLIRIPVSVLPGRRTQEGFGAEVQITIDPYISDEVLPLAFKDFVINGLVDRISFEVFEIARSSDIQKIKTELLSQRILIGTVGETAAISKEIRLRLAGYQGGPIPSAPDDVSTALAPVTLLSAPDKYSDLRNALKGGSLSPQRAMNLIESTQRLKAQPGKTSLTPTDIESVLKENNIPTDNEAAKNLVEAANADPAKTAKIVGAFISNLLANVNQQDLAIPSSHVSTVDGDTTLRLALHAYSSLVQTDRNNRFPYDTGKPTEPQIQPSHRVEHGLTMPEVQSLLRREAIAAYDFLSQPAAGNLWEIFSGPELARLVKEHRRNLADDSQQEFKPNLAGLDEKYSTGDIDSSGRQVVAVNPRSGVHDVRNAFFREMQRQFPQARNSVTEALTWQILVESALVNDQLCKDMRETATLKNCPCVAGDWMQFYGPNPLPEARSAFAEYVKCKWPIHVFALDPVTQDQNIADSFSQRREMQLAMAVAAANQGLGGQALSRFVRRQEYDLETIELNRTAIGFSHGDNTFGWRFYPRVQAPPVPSNLRATIGDLLIGQQGRDSRVRNYKLEPGMRECTALVVMPSFVPQVTVDVRSNYFRLTKHKPFYSFMKQQPGYESSTDLSRELTELRRLQQRCVADAHLYRDGEVFRLCKAVERLDRRLPLQTHHVTVPWENDLGGFETFQSGASMLEPELHGWYGAPGVVVLDQAPGRNVAAQLSVKLRELDRAKLDGTLAKSRFPADTSLHEKLAAIELTKQNEVNALNELFQSRSLAGTESAVYLTGKNFSVLNCRVTAGGVDITNTIEVINRNLLQVRIPSSVSTVTINHESTQRYVVVHLATPHGATSRLMIPVERDKNSDTPRLGDLQLEGMKKELETLKASTKTAIDKVKQTAFANSDSDEDLNITWGDTLPLPKMKIRVYEDTTTLHLHKFCPPTQADASLKLVKRAGDSQWPSEGKPFESESDLPISCELAVTVKTYKQDGVTQLQDLPVGPWSIVGGNFDEGTKLTAQELITRIFNKAGGQISCNTPQIQVQGFIRFRDGGKVTKVQCPIVFELERIKHPSPTP